MIDTHAHLIWDTLEDKQIEVVRNAKACGVQKILTVGCDILTSKKSLECAEKFEEVFFSAGVHPSEVGKQVNWKEFEKMLSHNKCKAVGECGFDLFYSKDNINLQKEIFVKQVEIATYWGLPIIIHSRDAGDLTLEIIKKHKLKSFVIHCFTETADFAKEIIDLGGLVSIGGIITYPNAKDLRKTIKSIPLERIMLETDAPYLAPQSVRGKINEPKYLPEIAEKLAEITSVTCEDVQRVTTENANTFFKLI